MTDDELIALFRSRDSNAIAELESKYSGYCSTVAFNILRSREDAEECLNDVYLSVWNSIPPAQPDDLRSFTAGITRNAAISRWRKDHAKKRGSGHIELLLEELSEAAASDDALDKLDDVIVLKDAFNGFLEELGDEHRQVFLLRYWYMHTINEIAENLGIGESKVKVSLHRSRKKLKKLLEKEGLL